MSVPLLHIADTTAEAVKATKARRPLLLATRYTMEQDFYVSRLRDSHGLDLIVPDADDRNSVHNIIFDELCCGTVLDASRQRYIDIIERGRAAGADSVILGCTEIGLLIEAKDIDLPTFDSTLNSRRCGGQILARTRRCTPAQCSMMSLWLHFLTELFSSCCARMPSLQTAPRLRWN